MPGQTPTVEEIARDIYEKAVARGIDPAMALGTALREGLNKNTISSPTFSNPDAGGKSIGPWQMHSPDAGRIAPGGMAYEFMQRHGVAPSASNWREQNDYALDQIKKRGYGPWYAVRDRGADALKSIGAAYIRDNNLGSSSSRTQTPAAPAGSNTPTQWSATDVEREGGGSFGSNLGDFLAAGKSESHATGINDSLGRGLSPFLEAARAAGHNITINSGYRDAAYQANIIASNMGKYGFSNAQRDQWNADVRALGAEAAGQKWASQLRSSGMTKNVALPGGSNHQKGSAADLAYSSPDALKWAHANASQYGLHFPMSHENWHIEPVRGGREVAASAPTGAAASGGSFAETLSANATASSNTTTASTDAPSSPSPNTETPKDQNWQYAQRNGDFTSNEQLAADANSKAEQEAVRRAMRIAGTTGGADPSAPNEQIAQVASSVQSGQLEDLARRFYATLSPQQKMMEQSAFAQAKRQKGVNMSPEEFFSGARFVGYLKNYASGNGGQFSQPQQAILAQVRQAYNADQNGTFAQRMMGLA